MLPRIAAAPNIHRRLLAWCNSPLFNWSETFPSLRSATLVIDPQHMLRLAFLASIRDFYSPPLAIGNYSRDQLWNHNIAVGVVASFIARTSGRADANDALLGGALHDFQLLIDEKLSPTQFSRWLAASESPAPDSPKGKLCSGESTARLCELLMRKWRLPERVIQTAASAAQQKTKPFAQLPEACCVSIANYLCSRAGWTATGKHDAAVPGAETFAILGVDSDLLRTAWGKIPQILRGCEDLE